MNYYTDAFRHYADFGGRATRSHFWFFGLINLLVYILILIVEMSMGMLDPQGLGPLSVIYQLAVLIPAISVTVRRLHDVGKSGWSLLLAFIPLIGQIILIVWYCRDSDSDNKYGPNPKASERLG